MTPHPGGNYFSSSQQLPPLSLGLLKVLTRNPSRARAALHHTLLLELQRHKDTTGTEVLEHRADASMTQ